MYLVVAVIIVLLIFVIARSSYDACEYLYGFWAAEDDDFCEDSGIKSMMLFIDRGSRGFFSRTRQCYIIVTDGFTQQEFTMRQKYALSSPFSSRWRTTAEVEFDDEQIWPKNVNVEVDRGAGTLTIHDGETVYARLYKHHDITAAASCVDVISD